MLFICELNTLIVSRRMSFSSLLIQDVFLIFMTIETLTTAILWLSPKKNPFFDTHKKCNFWIERLTFVSKKFLISFECSSTALEFFEKVFLSIVKLGLICIQPSSHIQSRLNFSEVESNLSSIFSMEMNWFHANGFLFILQGKKRRSLVDEKKKKKKDEAYMNQKPYLFHSQFVDVGLRTYSHTNTNPVKKA